MQEYSSCLRIIPILFLSLFVIAPDLSAQSSKSKVKAFPSAEGFAANVTGGRGGKVLVVNNLRANGPGSLNWACNQKGKRIIVFTVGGVIKGNIMIAHPDITILGQTAPSPGITIQGMMQTRWGGARSRVTPLNGIFRFLRFRPNRVRGRGGDCIQISHKSHFILDHISVAWGTDENMDFFGAQDVTIQWCSIEEPDLKGHARGKKHNFGLIIGFNAKNISIHHNLFAHLFQRAPLTDAMPLDYRNNVVYNHQGAVIYHEDRSQSSQWNIIGNTFIHGPNSRRSQNFYFQALGTSNKVTMYAKDNSFSWANGVSDPWQASSKVQGIMPRAKARKASKAFKAAPVETQKRSEAYDLVLEQAGCFPEDAITSRTKKEVKDKNGSWGRKDPRGGLLAGLKTSKIVDADKDGISDSWEKKNGLSSKNGEDNKKKMKSGYPAIEEYANQCAAWWVETNGKKKGPHEGVKWKKTL